MDLDLSPLAQNGANVLVTAMATDLWAQIRGGIGRLFGRGDRAAEEATLAELDEARATLESPDDGAARDAEIELRTVLRGRLRTAPEAAAEFAALVEEVAARLATRPAPNTMTFQANVDRGSTNIQAGGDVHYGPR